MKQKYLMALLIALTVTGGPFSLSLAAEESAPSQNNPAAVAVITAAATNSVAAPAVRPPRAFAEADLLQLLTSTLQDEYVKDRGELELRLTQPWKTRNVPDERLTLKVLDMPSLGVTPSFVVRFELRAGQENLGAWQMPVQAHVWRDVWVCHAVAQRGQLVADADLSRERRDTLVFHEPLAEFSRSDTSLELAESLPAGSPVMARFVRPRPVVRRGQTADALMQDGTLSITMKVEVLEDGVPGQIIRVRNTQSRRDIRGKVLDEQTILVAL
jgi:flagella basal body P-ring formation protein FlgA